MQFLTEFEKESFGTGRAAWEDFFRLQQSKNEKCLDELRRFLQSEDFRKPFRQVSFFARVEVPRLERERGRKMVEKLRALEEIWEDLGREPEAIPSPAWHADVLAAREDRIRAGTSQFADWAEAKRRIQDRTR